MSQQSLLDLPDEILVTILKMLDIQSIFPIMRSCKRLSNLLDLSLISFIIQRHSLDSSELYSILLNLANILSFFYSDTRKIIQILKKASQKFKELGLQELIIPITLYLVADTKDSQSLKEKRDTITLLKWTLRQFIPSDEKSPDKIIRLQARLSQHSIARLLQTNKLPDMLLKQGTKLPGTLSPVLDKLQQLSSDSEKYKRCKRLLQSRLYMVRLDNSGVTFQFIPSTIQEFNHNVQIRDGFLLVAICQPPIELKLAEGYNRKQRGITTYKQQTIGNLADLRMQVGERLNHYYNHRA